MSRVDRTPFWFALPLSTAFFLALFLIANAPGTSGKRLAASPSAKSVDSACVDGAWESPPGKARVDSAILGGVDWLVRHQFADGMWSGRTFAQVCRDTLCLGKAGDAYDTAVSAMAVLAILESGFASPLEIREAGSFSEAADRGLRWLASRQDEEGCFGPRQGKYPYGHALATLAFCRAYAVLDDPIAKHHARRAIRFLEGARNPGGAWRYGARDGESDTSVTLWAGTALAAARRIGVEVSSEASEGALRWLDEMTGPLYYEVSYDRCGGGSSSIPGINDRFEANETLTALAASVRIGLGADGRDPRVRECARRLSWNLPVWNKRGTSVDYYYWFAGMSALSRMGTPEDRARTSWSERVRTLLVRHQRRDRCADGSWDPVDKWGGEGGRVYSTAINILTLSLARE